MWNLLPTWAWWTIAAVVAATWLWAWALCRAAALGDDMVERLLREVGEDAAPATANPEGDREPAIAGTRLGGGRAA